jgi:hypothetical protein
MQRTHAQLLPSSCKYRRPKQGRLANGWSALHLAAERSEPAVLRQLLTAVETYTAKAAEYLQAEHEAIQSARAATQAAQTPQQHKVAQQMLQQAKPQLAAAQQQDTRCATTPSRLQQFRTP